MNKRKADESQTEGSTLEEIATICSAAVRFTKSLLAYGAENNWEDVAHSEGRSWNAGYARREWQYLSKKAMGHGNKRLKPSDVASTTDFPNPSPTSQSHFFYNPSHESRDVKLNYIARKATAAVLAATGACDEHAYVLAMLLRMLLPRGVPINICAMRDNEKNEDFSHTFVVLGNIQKESARFDAITARAYAMNDKLLAVDAWPIEGGVVRMRDFWLRDYPREGSLQRSIRVDCTFLSDGVDHLLKRVEKQKSLYSQLKADQYDFAADNSYFESPEEILEKQKSIHDKISTMPLVGYETAPGMWSAPSVIKSGLQYQEPPATGVMMKKILESYPLLKQLLEEVDIKLDEKKVPERKGSGFTS